MELIEQIREKCVAVNPKILAIEPGCLVENLEEGGVEIVVRTNLDMPKPEVYTDKTWPLYQAAYRFAEGSHLEGYVYRIIGRPIRLADVLLAMDEFMHPNAQMLVTTSGEFDDCVHSTFQAKWNLREDDLTKQSPETIAFISKVLGITS
jgi:hypothetical protein